MGLSILIEEGHTEIEVHGMTCRDFIYCEDCKEFVDFFQYSHNIRDTGHAKCKWRYVTLKELRDCVLDCEEEIPYCPYCYSIIDYEIATKQPCGNCGRKVTPKNAVWANHFGEG